MSVTYLPKSYAKEISGRYGKFLNVACNAAELTKFIAEHTDASGYIKFNISPRKQPDTHGNTHSVSLDTYEPKSRQAPAANEPPPANQDETPVPF